MWSDRTPAAVLRPNDLLTVEVESTAAGVRVVRPEGEIDLATAPLLRDALVPVLASSVRLVAVDLDDVGFLGAHGLDVLLDGYRTATARGVEFVLVGGHRPVLRVLSVTGLTSVMPMAGSLEQVLAR